MYLIGSLLLALGISVFLVSKIAELLHAKKPAMDRILIASLIGSLAAFITLVALSALVKDLDPMILLAVSILSMLLVSSLAFKTINQMTWAGAITTNIANVALVLITGTAAIVLNGESIGQTVGLVQSAFTTNTAVVENLATGDSDPLSVIANAQSDKEKEEELAMKAAEDAAVEDLEPTFKEIDLLPPATVKEMEERKNKVYKKAPRYYTINLSEIGSAVGKNIRIKNNKDNVIVGALKSLSGGNLVIEQRINGGLATVPLSRSNVQTIEVYR